MRQGERGVHGEREEGEGRREREGGEGRGEKAVDGLCSCLNDHLITLV